MRKKSKLITALILSATMLTTAFTGCSSDQRDGNTDTTTAPAPVINEDGTIDTSEHLDLKMYLLGDRSPDFDEVYGKINEILEEKLNCSLSVDFLSWGEHDTKYSLLFQSNEDFDLIFTASSWGHYEQTASLGGFYPLTEDFVKTYAPDIWDVVPEMAWDQAKIDGVPYMVPNYNNEFRQDVVAIRGDIMEQVGMTEITTYDELCEFAMKCTELGIYGWGGGNYYGFFQDRGMSTTGGAPSSGDMVLYNTMDPNDTNLYYALDWEEYPVFCHKMKEMADAGCWSPDVLNSTDERQIGLLTGRVATMGWNMGSCLNYGRQANAENPDWNVTIMDPISNYPKQVASYINNGMAINNRSTKKERAMMVLNEFMTNPEVYDLAMLGIEGKHWEAVGDDQYKVIDESNYGVSSNCNWGWNNLNLTREEYIENPTPLDKRYQELMDKWNNNVKPAHPLDGFNFDSTKVAVEFAAVEACIGTYGGPLANGLVDDVDASLEQFRSAMEAAGIRTVLEEMNRQKDAYLASKAE